MKTLIYICFFVILITIVSCKSETKPKPNPNLPPKYAVVVEPEFKHQGNLQFLSNNDTEIKAIQIEVADDNAKREKGMMYRKSMDEDKGMLFIFPDERRRSFWMKNTHIELDIIFVSANKEIVHIAENCQPYSTKSIPSFEYAKYVVEVNAGYCDKFGIEVGNFIGFEISD